jgi:hypothetical protein
MAMHKEYYKGEGGDFPPSPNRGEFYVSIFAHGSSVHQKCSTYALTNLLFVLCKSVWIIDLFFTLPNPYPRAPACLFTPQSDAS